MGNYVIPVQAMHWTGNIADASTFLHGHTFSVDTEGSRELRIIADGYAVDVCVGEWIVNGPGGFYVVADDFFRKFYVEVNPSPESALPPNDTQAQLLVASRAVITLFLGTIREIIDMGNHSGEKSRRLLALYSDAEKLLAILDFIYKGESNG